MDGQLGYWSINVPDADRAQRFYGELFGWSFGEPGGSGGVNVQGCWGGFHPVSGEVSPIAVLSTDLTAAISRVRALGGTADDGQQMPHGGYTEAADPAGARFGLVALPGAEPPAIAPRGHGQLGYWNLFTADQPRSAEFFSSLFGWSYGGAGSAGGLPIEGSEPLGFLSANSIAAAAGSLTFQVEDAAVAVQTVRRLGGTAGDAIDSPYGPFAQVTDDQNYVFGVWQRTD
ncbi:MAG: VOC family protein [Jatrophihabitantaceae bacterium]